MSRVVKNLGQTRDKQKTNYFQDNIALWKTLQDGISEQGFFLFVQ